VKAKLKRLVKAVLGLSRRQVAGLLATAIVGLGVAVASAAGRAALATSLLALLLVAVPAGVIHLSRRLAGVPSGSVSGSSFTRLGFLAGSDRASWRVLPVDTGSVGAVSGECTRSASALSSTAATSARSASRSCSRSVLESSGVQILDFYAERALTLTTLPPLPAAYPEGALAVRLAFEYTR